MRITVKDIKAEGLDLEENLSEEFIGLTEEDQPKLIEPLSVRAHFQKVEKTIVASTKLKSRISSYCYRCLEPIEEDWTKNVTLDFPFQHETDKIEVDDDIRQEVVLDMPIRMLCRKDCKGLCPDCGANLNIDECKCKEKTKR